MRFSNKTLASEHKRALKREDALFLEKRNEFIAAIVGAATPNWGGLKVTLWNS